MNIINFSGGRTSAYMTKRLIDEGGDYLVTFQNTGRKCHKLWISLMNAISVGT